MTTGIAITRRTDQQQASRIAIFANGQTIYADGEKCDWAYRVAFGAVSLYRVFACGRRQIVSFHLAGEWFGIEQGRRRQFTAEAIGPTGILCANLAADQCPALLPAVLDALWSAREHQLVISRQSSHERVAAFLLEISERTQDKRRFDLPMPRADIADYLGLTIESVSRAVTRLKCSNAIRLVGPRGIEILDRDRLRSFCD